MLQLQETVLMVVDVQGKLARIMHETEALIQSAARLIRGAKVLELPIVWTEQNPAGLGPTVPELAELLPGAPLPKLHFSCWADVAIRDALKNTGRNQVLLAGIEAHICVRQTAEDLLASGHDVHVVADAVSSRTAANRRIGLELARDAGARITSVEAALFELLEVAQGEKFKEVLRIVK